MNAHPNVIGPPEYSFIVYLYSRYGNKKHWTKADIAEFIEALYFRPLFSLWLINKDELTEKLNAIADKADYALICKIIFYQMSQGKENISLFCDKNPENSLFINTLLKVFPDAKFIHMVRDPRDNVNSQSRSFKKKNIYLIARRWMGYNTAIENEKKKMPARFHALLYENLVTTTEASMKAVCEFLGITYSPSMIEHQFNDRIESLKENKFIERVKTIHKGLLNPINTSNIGKWQKEMSPQSIAITESITGDLAKTKYGYKVKREKSKSRKKYLPTNFYTAGYITMPGSFIQGSGIVTIHLTGLTTNKK